MGDLTRKREKEITCCKILAALGEPGLIGRFLGEVMIKDAAVDPGKSLVDVCQTYGWDTFQRELEALFKNTTIENVERNVRLLEEICLSTPRKTGGLGRALRNRRRETWFRPLKRSTANQHPATGVRAQLNRAHLLSGLARAFGHRTIRIVVGRRVARLGLAGEVPAADCTSSRDHQPGPLAQEEHQDIHFGIVALGCRVPRATGASDRAGPARTHRLPSRRRNFVQVRRTARS